MSTRIMMNRGWAALQRASLAALSAVCLAGCVSTAAPGSTEAYATSIQATALAGGLASSLDPTGLSSVVGGTHARLHPNG